MIQSDGRLVFHMISGSHERGGVGLLCGSLSSAKLGVPVAISEINDDSEEKPDAEVDDTRDLLLGKNEDIDEHSDEGNEGHKRADESLGHRLSAQSVQHSEGKEAEGDQNDVEKRIDGLAIHDGKSEGNETPNEDKRNEITASETSGALKEWEASPDDTIILIRKPDTRTIRGSIRSETKDDNTSTDHGEGQERSNRNHIAENIQVQEGSQDSSKDGSNDSSNIGRLVLAELEHELEEQAVSSHLEENTRLSHE